MAPFLVACILFLACLSPSLAQALCVGTLSGTILSDVSVSSNCVLDEAVISGSVSVSAGATLTALGATQISGSVLSDGGGDIFLSGTTSVLGGVSVSNSPSSTVTIDTGATVNDVSLSDSGTIIVKGSAGGVFVKTSNEVFVTDGTVGGGGIRVELGTGGVTLCGASIAGSVTITETTGNLEAKASTTCAASSITGSVTVAKSTGNVILTGVTFASGDLLIVELTGSVSLTSAVLSDASISKTSGSIVLTSVTTDSDVSITDNPADVTIVGSSFTGDVGLSLNQAIEVRDSSFALENLSLKLNSGPVMVVNNAELSIGIEENDAVTLSGNTIESAAITKNTGGVSIVGNIFETLSCADNSPPPTGSGNSISVLADGQCSAL